MPGPRLDRRALLKGLLATLLPSRLASAAAGDAPGHPPASPRRIRAAAIQMQPVLADVQANLAQAERLIREALRKGARWIALPEMFTTAAGFHPRMLEAIAPIDGAPLQLLQRLAREGQAVIGGSFLARHPGDRVHNSFVLVSPDGRVARHDKDYPTYWENCYYERGGDDGVLPSPVGPIGSVLCWELIRSQTARRLSGRVSMVIGGSCWWTLPDDADPASPLRDANLKMLREAPVRMARMLGVPVLHGAHAGPFHGYFSPELPDVPYHSAYLGEAMVVDASGRVLARRDGSALAGVVLAEVEVTGVPVPSTPIPEAFWIPAEMPEAWQASWERWFETGGDYYQTVTRPFLASGVINEYVPPYLR